MNLLYVARWSTISPVTYAETGRFLFLSADGSSQYSLWAKRPVLSDLRPAACVTTSADSTGRFAFLEADVFGKRNYSVYIIESSSGHFKIGYSNNPKRRLEELKKTQGPYEYGLAFYWVCGDVKEARYIEGRLHHAFSGQRVRGEWFELTTKDLIGLSDDVDSIRNAYRRGAKG